MDKFKNKAVLAITAFVFAVIAINFIPDDDGRFVSVNDSHTTFAEPSLAPMENVAGKILDMLKSSDVIKEDRVSFIPEKSFITAVMQDDAIFDSKLVMGNRVVYDSGDDIKMVSLKASQVHIAGNRNAILDNCTIQAFAELGLLTAEIKSKKMHCMSLEGEIVDIPITLNAVGKDYSPGIELTDCQKVNVQQDNGDITPQCVTGSVSAGTQVTFVVSKDILVDVPIGLYTDNFEGDIDHISSVFYESELQDHTVEFDIELLQYGKVTFYKSLRTVDNIPVTMTLYGSNGYRQSIKQKEVEVKEEMFDFEKPEKIILASGALFRDGFRLTLTPVSFTDKTVQFQLSLDHQYLDTIDVFKHRKFKKPYELPAIVSGEYEKDIDLGWGDSIRIPVENVGTFVVTPVKKPGIQVQE